MELKDVVNLVQQSDIFVDWKQAHPDSFLAHAFVMVDEANKDVWQLGFFNPKKNVVTTFFVDKKDIKIIPDQEILKADGDIIPLKSDEVTISKDVALTHAKEILDKEYKNPQVLKTFFIVQQTKECAIFNITFFTQTLKTINVHVGASDGKILKHSEAKLVDFS